LVEGVTVVPTPAKEYALQSQVSWSQAIWIALGGPIATTVAALGVALYFCRKPVPETEAILAGVFLPLGFYSLRFILGGRGHDGVEWQAAQTALGLRPACHAIDFFFLCLFVAGLAIWTYRMPALRWFSLLQLVSLAITGVFFLVLIQVGNNVVFDRLFPAAKNIDVPAGLDPR
jgi:hypothetical protein